MASTQLGGASRHVKFLALACGGKLLASHVHWNAEAQEDYGETLKQIFASAGWVAIRAQAKTKLELKSGANVYCMELDGERVYCAVVTAGYPIRCVFSGGGGGGGGSGGATAGGARLMREFAEAVRGQDRAARESVLATTPAGALQRPLAKALAALAARFDDVEALDKLTKVGGQVKQLQATMAKNLVLADERHTLLDRELDKTTELAASARGFFERSGRMKRIVCARAWYVTLVVVFVVLGILAAIVLILNYVVFHWW